MDDAATVRLAAPPAAAARGRHVGGIWAVAAAGFLVEMAVSARYGYHRDELYFLACARHLAWGFVDQPPLTPAIARLGIALFGGSAPGIRLFSALAFAGLIALGGLLAREFGASRRAQVLAALSVAVCGEYLGAAHLLSPTPFDQVAWAATTLLVARLVRTGDRRLWLGVGLVAGLGLENKWSVLWLLAGLAVGLAATPERRLLRSRWAVGGAGLALAIWAPNLVWQAANGWPQLQLFRSLHGDAGHNMAVYWPAQIVYTSIVLVPVWVAGLRRLLADPAARRYRALGLAFVVVLVLFFVLGGKPYYPGPAYLIPLAAGSIPLERYLASRRPAGRRLAMAGLVAVPLLLLPVALPIVPARVLATVPLQSVNYDLGEQIGWPGMVGQVAAVYRALPPGERATAVILTSNYGEAGAIDWYGPALGLPQAFSGHNSFWLWGPPPGPPGTTVAVGYPRSALLRYFRSVAPAGSLSNGLGVADDEEGAPLFVCRGQRAPWPALWPALRHDN